MSLRRTTPLAFHPRGLSDALDSSLVFSGAMAMLRDLIPDPSTRGLWQCRPGSVELANPLGEVGGSFSSGFSFGFQVSRQAAFSPGFSSGFATSAAPSLVPAPVGPISALLIVGDTAYGMIGGGGTQDYPFAFNLKSRTFVMVGGVVSMAGGNLPTQQLSSGDWVPPTMDIIGSTVLVTHPGFTGTGNWLGWFDISNPTAPVWHAGNVTSTVSSAPVPFFSPQTGVPVAVKAFNGRAYWAYNPLSGPSTTIFSDVLAPLTLTNSGALQAITYDDNVPITALGALPLSNQLGGIIQSLMVFKGITNIYQITGDISLGSGPPLGTLAKNSLNVATGTFSPNSLAVTSKGLAFVSPDGVRIIDYNAQVSDPIGNEGMGKTLPFLYAVFPSRVAAAANGTVYRVSLQDGSLSQSPFVEYWLDFSRGGVWSGPHSFPARLIKPYKSTFVLSPYVEPSTLHQSDYLQTASSVFTEGGTPMSFSFITSLLPDTDQMSENAMIETTIYLGIASGSQYNVQALNESSSVLGSGQVSSAAVPAIWGQFNWGQAAWGGIPSSLFPQRIAWPKPIVFRRMAMSVQGPSSQQFRIGTVHMKYEQLGYLQQPLGSAA